MTGSCLGITTAEGEGDRNVGLDLCPLGLKLGTDLGCMGLVTALCVGDDLIETVWRKF